MLHHQAGRLDQAEALYREILAEQPDHADALHLLGLVARSGGNNAAAIGLIGRAIALRTDWPEAHYNLGIALKEDGRLDDAIAAYRQAVAINPAFGQAWNSLGNALQASGDADAAIAAWRQAIAVNPGFADAHNNLGNALKDLGKLDEAIAFYRRAIELKAGYAEAHGNLGVALQAAGRLEDAVAEYRRAISLNGQYSRAWSNLGVALLAQGKIDDAVAAGHRAITLALDDSHACNNLGNALSGKGEFDDAIASYRRAIALDPGLPEAYLGLGNALVNQRLFDPAIAVFSEAVRLRPGFAGAWNNLGTALIDTGQVEPAIAAFRRAVALEPDNSSMDSALVFALHYDPRSSASSVFDEHVRWNRRHAEPLARRVKPHLNDRGPDRRLRIGYVSPDFRDHPVGRFLLPLLENHDREQFEIFCYCDVARPDAITLRCESLADQWRKIAGMRHDAVAQQIRDDRIDILVDLSGHTSGNRLMVFAERPAPVQVSWLGYPGTTGMTAIDYRFTDALADPPGPLTDRLHTEKLYRLPRTNWCFAADDHSPPVAAAPATELGYVTFGSFNTLAKVTDEMLQVWGCILQKIPSSRLLLKAAAFSAESACERVSRILAGCGADPARLTILGPTSDHATHMAAYGRIDIALDTFPYHGTTTTCEALWMGVPVITLAGDAHLSRVGVSLLSNVGLPELIATSVEKYIDRAAALAGDTDRLQTLRRGLRERMLSSPLMDARNFARDVEAAYRQMWRP